MGKNVSTLDCSGARSKGTDEAAQASNLSAKDQGVRNREVVPKIGQLAVERKANEPTPHR